jgi:hypothetical protein
MIDQKIAPFGRGFGWDKYGQITRGIGYIAALAPFINFNRGSRTDIIRVGRKSRAAKSQ